MTVNITNDNQLLQVPLCSWQPSSIPEHVSAFLINVIYFPKFYSSFNDKPINVAAAGPLGQELFEREQEDLLADLRDIPKKACDRRVSWINIFLLRSIFVLLREGITGFFLAQINEFVKRARAAKIHSYIISHLRKEMPAMMGKAKAQQRLIDNLEDEFKKVTLLQNHCCVAVCFI